MRLDERVERKEHRSNAGSLYFKNVMVVRLLRVILKL